MKNLTVITICFNASSTIQATLDSIVEQDRSLFDYLIIDGNSTDNTLELIKKTTPFAHIISETDEGLYNAMNKGIQNASGEYICFLNAGDTFRNKDTVHTITQHITNKISEKKADIIYGDTMIVDKNRKDLHLRRLRPPKELNFYSFLKGMTVCHQAFIVKRSIAPFYNEKYKLSSDFDWCINILSVAKENIQINDVLISYLEGGLSHKYKIRSLKERFLIMKYHYGLLRSIKAHLSFIFKRIR